MTFISSTNKLLQHVSSNQQQQVARVLLVGSGRMGHIRAKAIYSNPRFELCGIVDSNIGEAAKLGQIYRTPHFRTLTEAIGQSSSSSSTRIGSNNSTSTGIIIGNTIGNNRSGRSHHPLNGIIISTPTPSHSPLITEASHHGISTFTEKPVDETASKIKSLFEISRRRNVQLCCGFQRRFDPSYLELYRQVNNNNNNAAVDGVCRGDGVSCDGGSDSSGSAIGKPLTANIFFGDHPTPSREFLLQGGGNIISDCSAHDVDYIRWILRDEVESVYATGTSSDEELREKGVIDNATMVMKFTRGTVVTLTLTRGATYGYDQRLEIHGTHGLASLQNIPSTLNQLANSTGIHSPKWQYSFPQRFEKAFENELDAFGDTLLLGKEWMVGEGDCVEVQRVCDAALVSCESGEVVRLVREEGDDCVDVGEESLVSQ